MPSVVNTEKNQTKKASTSLKKGASGSSVTALQKQLITLGYLKGTADGNFGPKTDAALRAFQKASGLSADGSFGSLSSAAMTKAIATPVKTLAPTPPPAPVYVQPSAPKPPPAPAPPAQPVSGAEEARRRIAAATPAPVRAPTPPPAPMPVARPVVAPTPVYAPVPPPPAPALQAQPMAPPPAPIPKSLTAAQRLQQDRTNALNSGYGIQQPGSGLSTVHQTSTGRLAGGGGLAMPPVVATGNPTSPYDPSKLTGGIVAQQSRAIPGVTPLAPVRTAPTPPPAAPLPAATGSPTSPYDPQAANAPVSAIQALTGQPTMGIGPANATVQQPVIDQRNQNNGNTNTNTNNGTGGSYAAPVGDSATGGNYTVPVGDPSGGGLVPTGPATPATPTTTFAQTTPSVSGTPSTSEPQTTSTTQGVVAEPQVNSYFNELGKMLFDYDASTDQDYLRASAALENQISQAMIGRGGLYSSVQSSAVQAGLMGLMLDFENKAYTQFKEDRNWMMEMAKFQQDMIDTAWGQNMEINKFNASREDTAWDKAFKERQYATDQANTAWDQGFKVSQFNADREDTAWEQGFKVDQFTADRADTAWDQGFKSKQFSADRADTAWDQNFKITQYNASRADEAWDRSYKNRQAAAAAANKTYSDKEADVSAELGQYATAISGLRSQYTNSKTTMSTLLTRWTKTGKADADIQQFFGVSADATMTSGYNKILAKKNELSEMNSYINQLQTEYDAGSNAIGSVREAIDGAKPQANENFTGEELRSAYSAESQKLAVAFKSMTRAEMLATISNLQGKNAEDYIYIMGADYYNRLISGLKAKVPSSKSAVRMPVSSTK